MCHLLLIHPTPFGAALAVEVGLDLIHSRSDLVVGDQVEKLIRLKNVPKPTSGI